MEGLSFLSHTSSLLMMLAVTIVRKQALPQTTLFVPAAFVSAQMSLFQSSRLHTDRRQA
jgi:hydrogenase/urease accessory protein HupE